MSRAAKQCDEPKLAQGFTFRHKAKKEQCAFRMESQPGVLSFPRKRESIALSKLYWMPAFAGMTRKLRR
jgi:hypothetical protein